VKNLIKWISDGKFANEEKININAKSIKLSVTQIKKLRKLLDEKRELESGVLLFNDELRAELFWKEPARSGYYYLNDFEVPIGTKASGVSFGGNSESIDTSEFIVKSLTVEKDTKASKVIFALCHRDYNYDKLLKVCEKDVHKWYDRVDKLHDKFVEFFWEIKLPCWVNWYAEDTETGMFSPPWAFDEETPFDCWTEFDADMLNQAMNILVEGNEVVFENIEPYKEVVAN
jgi:hypothetical protein